MEELSGDEALAKSLAREGVEAPAVIKVPVGHIPPPRAKLIQHVSKLPWTVPREGLISP